LSSPDSSSLVVVEVVEVDLELVDLELVEVVEVPPVVEDAGGAVASGWVTVTVLVSEPPQPATSAARASVAAISRRIGRSPSRRDCCRNHARHG
jgi:hypothetical protein